MNNIFLISSSLARDSPKSHAAWEKGGGNDRSVIAAFLFSFLFRDTSLPSMPLFLPHQKNCRGEAVCFVYRERQMHVRYRCWFNLECVCRLKRSDDFFVLEWKSRFILSNNFHTKCQSHVFLQKSVCFWIVETFWRGKCCVGPYTVDSRIQGILLQHICF